MTFLSTTVSCPHLSWLLPSENPVCPDEVLLRLHPGEEAGKTGSHSKILKLSKVSMITVPKFNELVLSKIYKSALKKVPELVDSLPHNEEDYLPPRDFFWVVLNALNPGLVSALLKQQQDK